jgi:hypothetical protein
MDDGTTHFEATVLAALIINTFTSGRLMVSAQLETV